VTAAEFPTVVGLDLSLAGTGVAVWPAGEHPELYTLTNRLEGLARLQWIRGRVTQLVRGADLVVVEGLQPRVVGAYALERGGLYWLILDRLSTLSVPVAVVQSSGLKCYALGVGGGVKATKAAVVASVVRRYNLSPTSDDEADAAVLAAMGLEHLGHPPAQVPGTHARALTAVRWPA
jgi:crossover junction endodeoxyribonuclease RuvC